MNNDKIWGGKERTPKGPITMNFNCQANVNYEQNDDDDDHDDDDDDNEL